MNPLTLLTGVWGYVTAAVLSAGLSIFGTYYLVHTANAVEISSLKLAASQQQSANVSASLSQLQGFIAKAKMASDNYAAALVTINSNFADVKKSIANATQKPLPVDCKPDAGRLRALTAAVAAANGKAANPAK